MEGWLGQTTEPGLMSQGYAHLQLMMGYVGSMSRIRIIRCVWRVLNGDRNLYEKREGGHLSHSMGYDSVALALYQ
jgi:hypothetical protein